MILSLSGKTSLCHRYSLTTATILSMPNRLHTRCSFAVSAEGSKIGKASQLNSIGFEAAQQVRLHDILQHPHQNKIIRLDVVHIVCSAMLVSTALADHCVSMRLLSTTLEQLHFAHQLFRRERPAHVPMSSKRVERDSEHERLFQHVHQIKSLS